MWWSRRKAPVDSLKAAVKRNDLHEVKAICQNIDKATLKTLLDGRDQFNDTALHVAAYSGYLDILKYLISRGADVNSAGRWKRTPLIRAARGGHLDCVKYLVEEAGADISVREQDNCTALHCAAYYGKLDILKYLISRGADVNSVGHKKSTPLIRAAENSHLDCVRYLLSAGADINSADENGDTCLHWAVFRKQTVVLKYLLNQRDINTDLKNVKGQTAADMAIAGKNMELIGLFINNRSLQQKLEQQSDQLEQTEKEREALTKKNNDLEQEIVPLREKMESLLSSSSETEKMLRRELEGARGDLMEKQKSVSQLEQRLEEMKDNLEQKSNLQEQMEKEKEALFVTIQILTKKNKDLEQQNVELLEKQESLQSSSSQLVHQVTATEINRFAHEYLPYKEYKLSTFEFKGSTGEWVDVDSLHLHVDSKELKRGGVRQVFLATQQRTGKKYVVKRYLPNTKTAIQTAMKTSLEPHAKLEAQKTGIASYYADKFTKESGHRLSYVRVFISKEGEETVFIEEFMDKPAFFKFVDNKGGLTGNNPKGQDPSPEQQKICEALAHYSLHESGGTLMLCDIQGWFPELTDPEVATKETKIGNIGTVTNFSKTAISAFAAAHQCSDICKNLKLLELQP